MVQQSQGRLHREGSLSLSLKGALSRRVEQHLAKQRLLRAVHRPAANCVRRALFSAASLKEFERVSRAFLGPPQTLSVSRPAVLIHRHSFRSRAELTNAPRPAGVGITHCVCGAASWHAHADSEWYTVYACTTAVDLVYGFRPSNAPAHHMANPDRAMTFFFCQ